MDIDTVINSEAERLQWIANDPFVTDQECHECTQGQFPMYLALDISQNQRPAAGDLGHGAVRATWRSL